MTKKILEITEKIYTEGVLKAKKEADLIILNAKKEADNIVNKALTEEKNILEKATKEAASAKNNANSEIQLASQQFTSKLKQEISNIITIKQIKTPVKTAFNDVDFVKKLILSLLKNWNPQKPEEYDIKFLLNSEQEKTFVEFFEQKAKDYLNSGVEMDFDPNIKSGFNIGPKDDSYYISFTDKDFENYFKKYLSPKMKKMLFE